MREGMQYTQPEEGRPANPVSPRGWINQTARIAGSVALLLERGHF